MAIDNKNVQGVDDMLQKLQAAKQYLNRDVNKVFGVEAVDHFKEGFQNEGFTDKSLVKWETRKSKRSGGTNSQKVLSKSGDLADSITFRVEENATIIYSDKVYAQIHNEGGKITVTYQMRRYFWAEWHNAKEAGETEMQDQWKAFALSQTIEIKQRKFMGESQALNQKIIAKIERDLTRILNQ